MTLAIIQARLKSERLPNKMLLPLNGWPVIWWAWNQAREFYSCTVVACPVDDCDVFREALPIANIFGYTGDENDVLGRFHACAHQYATSPATIIARITPDDIPIDVARERFTLKQLDEWHATVTDPYLREHIGLLMPKRIELNTPEDYEAAKRLLENQ